MISVLIVNQLSNSFIFEIKFVMCLYLPFVAIDFKYFTIICHQWGHPFLNFSDIDFFSVFISKFTKIVGYKQIQMRLEFSSNCPKDVS